MRNAGAAVARSAALAASMLWPGVASGAVPLPRDRSAAAAGRADVTLPPARPEVFGPPLPLRAPVPPPREVFGPPAPPVPRPTPAPPEPDTACGPLLAGGTVVAHAASPVSGPGGCGIATPVTLDAVVLRDGRRVPLTPPVLLRCDLAAALADWLRDDVAPAAVAEGGLVAVADAAAYACRSRDRIAGERLSEHARGNAVDLVGFRAGKRTVGLNDGTARATLALLRSSACARFATVLGPGSDRYHAAVLHLDLARRRGGAKLCEWDLP